MANYMCVNRTNYFKVTDMDEFKKFLSKVKTDTEEPLLVWNMEIDGNPYVAFGSYNDIIGIPDETGEEDYDLFLDGLQKYVVEGDAVLLFHTGHEKLRYVTGCTTVVTKISVDVIDMAAMALKLAKEKLDNPEFETVCEY